MSKKLIITFLLISVLVISYLVYLNYGQQTKTANTLQSTSISTPSPTPELTPVNQVLGVRTKDTNCVVINSLPDKNCTPGAIIAGVTKEQVCTPGYSKAVRNVPLSEKDDVFREYGVLSHQPGQYEVDHLISLELGGSNSISNLWPEPADPKPGFHEKDAVENFLHSQVCSGVITLEQAQQQISNSWLEVYQKIQ